MPDKKEHTAFGLFVSSQNIGKRVKTSKRKIIWRFIFADDKQPHEVVLKHSIMSGKREVFFDDHVIHNSQKVLTTKVEFDHAFTCPGHLLRVIIRESFDRFMYSLYIDNVPFRHLPKYRKGAGQVHGRREGRREVRDSRSSTEDRYEKSNRRSARTTSEDYDPFAAPNNNNFSDDEDTSRPQRRRTSGLSSALAADSSSEPTKVKKKKKKKKKKVEETPADWVTFDEPNVANDDVFDPFAPDYQSKTPNTRKKKSNNNETSRTTNSTIDDLFSGNMGGTEANPLNDLSDLYGSTNNGNMPTTAATTSNDDLFGEMMLGNTSATQQSEPTNPQGQDLFAQSMEAAPKQSDDTFGGLVNLNNMSFGNSTQQQPPRQTWNNNMNNNGGNYGFNNNNNNMNNGGSNYGRYNNNNMNNGGSNGRYNSPVGYNNNQRNTNNTNIGRYGGQQQMIGNSRQNMFQQQPPKAPFSEPNFGIDPFAQF